MIISAIDIGTNTVLLLIAEVDSQGIITPIDHQQRIPRLGKGVDAQHAISVPAFDRIAWILNEYKNISLQFQAAKIVACATSAVRESSNQKEFLDFQRKTTGIEVEILTGEEEAMLTYQGCMTGISERSQPYAVLDVGGGSTELTFPNPGASNGDSKLNRYSFQLGAVRISERFFKHDPPRAEEIESARQFILEELAQVRNPGLHAYRLIGVAGTATTLACLDQGLVDFDMQRVSGYEFTPQQIGHWRVKLGSMSSAEIRGLSHSTEGRADILAAGVLIIHEVIELFRFERFIISERGLRYGMILRDWKERRGAPSTA